MKRDKWLVLLVLLTLPMMVRGQVCDSLHAPVYEPFDFYGIGTTALPDCWTASRNYDLGYAPHLECAPQGGTGAAMVLYPGSLAGSHYSMLIAPPLAGLDALDGIYLSVRILSPTTASRLVVGLCEDTGRYNRAFVPIDTLHVAQGNRWQEAVIDLGSYTGTGRRVAFRMERGLQSDSSEFYIDDVRVSGCGTTQPWVSHLGCDRMTLHFEPFGMGTVEVAYGNTVISPAVSPLVVEGLTSDSDYTFSIGCAGGQQQSFTARTMEGDGIVAEYLERFASAGSDMPVRWRRPTANKPHVVNGALQFAPSVDSCVAVMPRLTGGEVSEMSLSLDFYGTGSAALVVGVMEFADEVSSFVPVDTLWPGGDGHRLVSFAGYGGEGRYVAFMAVGGGVLRVDNLRLARCLTDNLCVYNLTDDGFTVSWDTIHLADGAVLNIEYGLTGFAQGNGTVVPATASPMTVAGLFSDTEYELYLYSSCGDSVSDASRISFHTFAHEVVPPYCEGFESDATLPQGWVLSAGAASITGDALRGDKALRLNGTVAMPLLGDGVADTVVVEFYGYGSAPLVVGLAESPYASIVPVDTISASSNWGRYVVTVVGAAGRCPIFRTAGQWTIDAVAVRTKVIASASVSSITTTEARIGWAGTDSVVIEYAAVGAESLDFPVGIGISLSAASDTVIGNLTPGSSYCVHLVPAHGGASDCSYLTLSFSTLDPPLQVPWCQNFDAQPVGSLPQGWRRMSMMGDYPIVSRERSRNGERSLLLVADATHSTIGVLPDADGCGAGRALAFWSNRTNTAARLEVGLMADITDTGTFVPVDTLVLGAAGVWKGHQVHVDSLGDAHIAMRLTSSVGTARLFLDDLCVDNCSAYNIRAYGIDSTGFNISWQAADSVALRCTVRSQGQTLVDTLRISPARLEGLDSGAAYSVTFEALCSCGEQGMASYGGYGSTGSVTSRSTSIGINTRVSPVHAPYCEAFENLPVGWTPHAWRTSQAQVTELNSHNGNHSLRVGAGGSIIMRQIIDATQMSLSMHLYANDDALLADGAIVVGVMSNPDSSNSFVPTDTLRLDAIGSWQHRLATLAADSGGYICLRVGASQGTLYIDDVVVASCAIDSASVSDAGVVSWTGVDSVYLEYGPVGFQRGSGIADTAGQSFVMSGLSEGVAYDIYLSPICADGSCQTLKLALGNILLSPYCESFDDVPAEGMPSGWDIASTYGSTPSMQSLATQALHMRASAAKRTIVVMPELAVSDIAAHELSLSMRASSAVRTRLLVGSIGDGLDPNTFVPHDTLTVAANNSWHRRRLPLEHHTGGRIALACEATVQTADLWIDSVGITRGIQPAVQAVSARCVRVVGTGGYYIDYAPISTPQGDGVILYVDTTSLNICDLTPDTAYRFYTSADSGATCTEPIVVLMPTEVSLPYCYGSDTAASVILPEPNADNISSLHLYFNLLSSIPVEVGVMSMRGDWSTFQPVDTVTSEGESHVSLVTYNGSGRFVALRSIGDGNIAVDGLMLSACELPAFELTDSNTLILQGEGLVEYGISGFVQGEGSVVQCPDTIPLADNTAYDIFLRCADQSITCAAPRSIVTHVDHCLLPDSLHVSQPGNGVVELRWDTLYSGFFIEYAIGPTPQGNGTIVRTDHQPLVLILSPDTVYNLFVRCDSLQSTARHPQQIHTLTSETSVPYCVTSAEGFVGWRYMTDAESGSRYYILPQPDIDSLRHLSVALRARFVGTGSHTLTLGTMSDAADPTTFDPQATFTLSGSTFERCFHALTNYYGNGRFLALRIQDGDVLQLDEVSLSTSAAYDFSMSGREADYVIFSWQQIGNPEVSIEYGEPGFAAGSGITVHAALSPFRVEGLSPLTNYSFYVSSRCLECCDSNFVLSHTSLVDTFFIFTPQGGTGCIDYTDLNASYVTCSYGSYMNPTEHQGAVDYGYISSLSRHTVHFDTSERDARTQGLLRTIPLGEQASVRLGNWTSSGNSTPQAESITYGMTVDADESDLLLLRYAAVLQDPEHASSLQPRFRLEILNQDYQLIDSVCSRADFIANAALDWNQAPNEVLWKDWTTVGVDISAYDGQTIFVRLTTNDCGEGSHFGYAYFTLRCARRLMLAEGCSNVPSNRFTVPDGFNYRWWSSLDTTQVISDSASILVPSDNDVTYYCRLSFVDNPTCHFSMSAFAGARYPLALFDTVLTATNCEYDLSVYNRSTISMDGVTPVGTGEPCETIRWILPDSSESTSSSLAMHFTDTGEITLSLIAGIANEQCLDTMTRRIVVRRPYPDAFLSGPSVRCANFPDDTICAFSAASYQWCSGIADAPAMLAPHNDTLLVCYTVDSNGCSDTLSHLLIVHDTSHTDYSDTVCSSNIQYSWLDTLITFTRVDHHVEAGRFYTDRHGCDSTMSLRLSLWPSYAVQMADTICDGGSYQFYDTMLTTMGVYSYPDTTVHGCDSIVSMDFSVMPRYWVDDVRENCDSLRWTDGFLYVADTTGPIDTLSTVFGCDSVATLYLTVHRSSHHDNDTAVSCADATYTWRNLTVPVDTSITEPTVILLSDTLATMHGCDSVLTMTLTRLPLIHASIRVDYLCADSLYRLSAVTDAPYWVWETNDTMIPMVPYIDTNPEVPTVFMLTAGYGEQSLCAVGAMEKITPLVLPEARLRVAPEMLSLENLDFEARDVGRVYAERAWYYNGDLLATTARAVYLSASHTDDTVSVALIVSDGHCPDTAIALLPIQHNALRVANAFTPGAADNNTFRVAGFNIARFEIKIYNRRGLLVYQSNDFGFEWDGRDLGGVPCPEGAYVYHIMYSTVFSPSQYHKQVGSVLLIR